MIFSDSPQQRALERMMTAVPRFRPKGGGIMVLHHFEYTAEMCDCRYCLYYCRKCTADSCPCIEERILAGAAGRSEVMSETMKDIHNAAFRRRLNQFIRESEELDKEIADLAARNLVIVRLHTSGILNGSDYSAQSSEINNKKQTMKKLKSLRIKSMKKSLQSCNLANLSKLKLVLDRGRHIHYMALLSGLISIKQRNTSEMANMLPA